MSADVLNKIYLKLKIWKLERPCLMLKELTNIENNAKKEFSIKER